MTKSIKEFVDGLLGIKRCPFCIEPAPRLQKCVYNKNDYGNLGTSLSCYWHCPQCNGDFCIEEDFLEPIYPPLSKPFPASYNGTTNNTSNGTKATYSNGLCPRCNHYQEIMMHLLLAYEGPKPDIYRQELERSRYPLCAACQFAVQQRLRRVAYQVRAKQILKQGPKIEAVHQSIVSILFVAMLVAALWNSSVVFACCLWHCKNGRCRRMLLLLLFSALAPDALAMAASFLSLINVETKTRTEASPIPQRPASLANLRLSDEDPPTTPMIKRPVFPILKADPLPGTLRPTPLPPAKSSPALESMLASFSLHEDTKKDGNSTGSPVMHLRMLRWLLVIGRIAMWHFQVNLAFALFAVYFCVLPVRKGHATLCILRFSSPYEHPMLLLVMDTALLLL